MNVNIFADKNHYELLRHPYWTQGMSLRSVLIPCPETNDPLTSTGEVAKPEESSMSSDFSQTMEILCSLDRAGQFDYLKAQGEDIYSLSDGQPL